MTITNTTLASATFNGNGATTAFATGFQFIANADLQVIVTSALGVETVKTITTHYTVTGAGNSGGGTVTFLVAPATGEKVNIRSNITLDQQTDYVEGGSFSAATHETALDKLTKAVQQVKEITDRSIKLPIANQSITTQAATPTASYVLRMNSANTAVEWASGASIGLTGAATVKDTEFTVTDDSDTTKKLVFEASGISTATTRTLTVPNASGTIALTSDLSSYQPLDTELTAIAGLTSAADKGIQFTGAGTAGVYDLTTAGKALLDDADASAQRTTLGLGTIATQAANNVTITGGSVTGITDITLADGGTGASLADPNADRIMFWDDSAGQVTWLTAGSNLTITGTTLDAASVGTNTFGTIAVSGQSDVVADSSTDTLTLVAGSGMTITTDAGTDTITLVSSGGVSAATQSEQETASSTSVYVSPGRQQFHPSAAKFWLLVTNTAGTFALTSSYNITSITDGATGLYSVTIATDMSASTYCVVSDITGTDTASLGAGDGGYGAKIYTRAVGTYNVQCVNYSGSAFDAIHSYQVGFGDQ